MTRQPEAVTHGDAWRYFCKEMQGRQYGEQETRDAWLFFLAGWKAKAAQRERAEAAGTADSIVSCGCDKAISSLPVFDEFEARARMICVERGLLSLDDLQRASLAIRVEAYHEATRPLIAAKLRLYAVKLPRFLVKVVDGNVRSLESTEYDWTDEERDALKNLDQAIDAEARRLGLLPATRQTK